jgi:hypothetical protein
VICAPGFTVKDTELLVKAGLVPLIDTRYTVGLDTASPLGIVNVTLRMLPATVITLAGVIEMGPLPPVRVTVTLEGEMVPLGNPLPVMARFVMPACPEFGEMAINETGVAAPATPAKISRNADR